MKKELLGLLLCFLLAPVMIAANRDAEWKKVQEAIQQGLPRTAITNLEPIIQAAVAERSYAEAVKAIGRKIVLEAQVQGNKPEEKITRLQAEIAKAAAEMVPMFETLLAHWYWQYFQQNRWRFVQRTATAQAPGTDFTTWDLPRILAEIDAHFTKALARDNLLKSTPVSAWDDLLEKGTMPDAYRPTLYDFISYEALGFYTAGEQAGAQPQDALEVSAESPILDAPEAFLAWSLTGAVPAYSPTMRTIQIFQQLLRFHQSDPAPQLAFASADLERLNWGWNTAFGENKNARYKAALDRFIRKYADFDISALAYERQARVLQQEGDLVSARSLAQRGAQLFPESPGGRLCSNLVVEIQAKSAQITTERVWNAPWPKIEVRYKNVEQVYFRAIPYSWEELLRESRYGAEQLDEERQKKILAIKAAYEWSQALAPTADFKQHTVLLPAPEGLKPGFYYIAASHNPQFSGDENMVSLARVWVSDLALVTRTSPGVIEGFVLEANSGLPISGAEVRVWHFDNNGNLVDDPSLKADSNGLFSLKPSNQYGHLLLARHNGRELASANPLQAYRGPPDRDRAFASTVFFTDRSIYRPGQTIQFKGVCIWADQGKDRYEVLKGETLTVAFRDVNGKEIARQQFRANDYGSFSGSFTAPRDRLMGQMSLNVVDGRARGRSVIRVEEYKRPKFETTLDAPRAAPHLNEEVTMTGRAVSYTGAPVDGALVRYRVVREVRMPWWWSWGWRGRPGQAGESREIAHGTVSSNNEGTFEIKFRAVPDRQVPEKDEPTFSFHVFADVTDSAGETRSTDRLIRVGYTALEARITSDDWHTFEEDVRLNITTRSLDDEPQIAEGNVKIYELVAPAKVERPPLTPEYYPYAGGDQEAGDSPEKDQSKAENWPLGKLVAEKGFTTDTNGTSSLSFRLPVGAFRAVLETQDRFGKKVTDRGTLKILNPAEKKLDIKIPYLLVAPSWQSQPGRKFMALWGTGYETGRAFVEIEHRQKLLKRFWTEAGQTQQQIVFDVTEEMRGGFTLHVTFVHENRGQLESRHISVPWINKELDLKWEHFVSRLDPAQKETWTLVVHKATEGETNRTAEKATAELAATLFDESLDAFSPHNWLQRFTIFYQDHSAMSSLFANNALSFQPLFGQWSMPLSPVVITWRSFPVDLAANYSSVFLARAPGGFARGRAIRGMAGVMDSETLGAPMAAMPAMEMADAAGVRTKGATAMRLEEAPEKRQEASAPGAKPDLSTITARKNLNETAFFYPQLTSDSNGVVRLSFTMPEALTRWRFMAFAHDTSVRSGYLEAHTVTSKDLMVQPNPPRFLREGDMIEFAVKVSNQSEASQSGTVRLTFAQAISGESADALLKNQRPEVEFSIPGKQSRSFTWKISVPDACGFLTYKAVASTASLSDGEEGAVPVLSRRILVTESLPLPIRGPATKKFEFVKLLQSGGSKTLQNQSLTVQMVSNPAWYAVLALPYLIEFPYECSEQIFNRLYANALARSIANSDPKIRRIFDLWKNTPALDSPLEKNQDLKSVMIEETPWLRQANNESQARRNVGVLFDENRLNNEQEAALRKLVEMQLQDGSWPWFPGGHGNDYITLYITAGFGRLRHLSVDVNVAPAKRALGRLDAWMTEQYQRIQKQPDPDLYVISSTDALYLYARAFFLKDTPIPAPNRQAVEFFLTQARKFWLKTGSRQTQGHIALALQRFAASSNASDPTPAAIMRSLKERSVTDEEMGMFWRDTELSWWWYHAPIETQALMIEAFDEVAQDLTSVEECRVWLLKQKQTQDWKTTKATADAVYALLLRGRDILSSDALVEVKLDALDITPPLGTKTPRPRTSQASTTPATPIEPGTGFYEVRFLPNEIQPKFGEITVKKVDQGIAWGSVHWQYLEDMSKVTAHAATPLKLNKSLYKKINTSHGPELQPAKDPLQVGDELVVRIELRTDRDMEYVHMKDQRGSGTEPVNVVSRYRYQDGLAYYESTRDTASHFFIDYLPKGTYVFEYSTRIQLRGEYQTGIAEIQCMYAPEFNSHSQSIPLVVQ